MCACAHVCVRACVILSTQHFSRNTYIHIRTSIAQFSNSSCLITSTGIHSIYMYSVCVLYEPVYQTQPQFHLLLLIWQTKKMRPKRIRTCPTHYNCHMHYMCCTCVHTSCHNAPSSHKNVPPVFFQVSGQ